MLWLCLFRRLMKHLADKNGFFPDSMITDRNPSGERNLHFTEMYRNTFGYAIEKEKQ